MVPEKDRWKKEELDNWLDWSIRSVRVYENGSVQLRDLEGLELPERVNIGKLKKYWVESQIQEMARSQDTEERESQEPENQQAALGEVTRRVTRQQTRLTQEAEVAEVGITEKEYSG